MMRLVASDHVLPGCGRGGGIATGGGTAGRTPGRIGAGVVAGAGMFGETVTVAGALSMVTSLMGGSNCVADGTCVTVNNS